MSHRHGRLAKLERMLVPQEGLTIRVVYVPGGMAEEDIAPWIQAHPEATERVIHVPGGGHIGDRAEDRRV
jgi:hypothetical protein